MTLLLIRHGETAFNAARVLQPPETPLSTRGRAQADALARHLRDVGVRTLLCSDLPRARETAGCIAQACGLALPAPDDPLGRLLHERHFGAWRGQAYDQLPGHPLTVAEAPPGGESLAEFRARVDAAWGLVQARAAAAEGPVAVVTHGLVLAEWLTRHLHWPETAPARPLRLRNTSVTEVDARAPHTVRRADCIEHLPAALRAPSDALTGG